jgi:hypothetical protein
MRRSILSFDSTRPWRTSSRPRAIIFFERQLAHDLLVARVVRLRSNYLGHFSLTVDITPSSGATGRVT